MSSRLLPSTDGVEIALHELGGDGPPLLLCHANGFHGRIWAPVADALADRYRCVSLDFRGHGDSRIPPGLDMAWSGMADDLLVAVADLSPDEPLRCAGWSMGGASIVLAELRRPGTVAAAFLYEPILFPPRAPDAAPSPLAEGARRRRERFASRDEAYERYHGRPPFHHADPRSLRAYVEHGFHDDPEGGVVLACRGEIEAQVYEASDNGGFERLAQYSPPSVVVASGDGDGPALIAPLVADAAPNTTLLRMDDLSHFGPLEAPERIAAAIAAAVDPGTSHGP